MGKITHKTLLNYYNVSIYPNFLKNILKYLNNAVAHQKLWIKMEYNAFHWI